MIGDLNVCIVYEMYPFLAEKLTPIRNWQLVILSCYVVAVLSSILHVISFVTVSSDQIRICLFTIENLSHVFCGGYCITNAWLLIKDLVPDR